jgi:hypothetical protein
MKYLQDKSSQEINTFVCCGIRAKLVGARLPAPGKISGQITFKKGAGKDRDKSASRNCVTKPTARI